MKGDFAMEKTIINEETGIQYNLVDGYYLPNLTLPPQETYSLGLLGRMRLRYLKDHRRVLHINLLTSGTLDDHLREVDEAANDRLEIIVKKMAAAQGVDEQLKAENQMLWVQRMNNIRNRAEEIVLSEIVYC